MQVPVCVLSAVHFIVYLHLSPSHAALIYPVSMDIADVAALSLVALTEQTSKDGEQRLCVCSYVGFWSTICPQNEVAYGYFGWANA